MASVRTPSSSTIAYRKLGSSRICPTGYDALDSTSPERSSVGVVLNWSRESETTADSGHEIDMVVVHDGRKDVDLAAGCDQRVQLDRQLPGPADLRLVHHHAGAARSSSRISSPYLRSFDSPTPDTRSSSARLDGLADAMAASVTSWNT